MTGTRKLDETNTLRPFELRSLAKQVNAEATYLSRDFWVVLATVEDIR